MTPLPSRSAQLHWFGVPLLLMLSAAVYLIEAAAVFDVHHLATAGLLGGFGGLYAFVGFFFCRQWHWNLIERHINAHPGYEAALDAFERRATAIIAQAHKEWEGCTLYKPSKGRFLCSKNDLSLELPDLTAEKIEHAYRTSFDAHLGKIRRILLERLFFRLHLQTLSRHELLKVLGEEV